MMLGDTNVGRLVNPARIWWQCDEGGANGYNRRRSMSIS